MNESNLKQHSEI